VAAGNTLNQVNTELLTDSGKAACTTLWGVIADQYYRAMYNLGYEQSRAGNHQEAANYFQIVANYNIDYESGYCAYHLAQSYRKAGNNEAARPYYQYIIDHYPNTERADTARRYVNEP
jgi:TolA-binding protein